MDRIGDTNINKQGLKMKIKEYRKTRDIDVEFENGYIVYNTECRRFDSGTILCPNKTGFSKLNKNGNKMTITKDFRGGNIEVTFDDGYKTKTTWKSFQTGSVISVFETTVGCIGYIGEGIYVPSVNGKHTPEYSKWKSMIKRCYDSKTIQKQPTYKDVIICEEWLNFQNFAKWFHENYYEVEGEKMNLDKDILVKGSKIYSPETCIFTPQFINTLFIKTNSKRGNFPIGVTYKKDINKYLATVQIKKKHVHIGVFSNQEEAFHAYKQAKEQYIKKVADEYKDKIPQKLYEAMYNWKVEITD